MRAPERISSCRPGNSRIICGFTGSTPFRGHVLYHGKPLANALVVALLHGRPSVNLETHSDPQGAITLPLPCPGIWLIKSVHMVRASFFASEDWDSFWASLTVEIPEPEPELKP
jgi:hypothetical protein